MAFMKNNFLPQNADFSEIQRFHLFTQCLNDKQYPEMMFALSITHIKILPKIWGHPSKCGIKSNLGTSGKLHALLSSILFLHLYRHRVQKSIFFFFLFLYKNCIFHIF